MVANFRRNLHKGDLVECGCVAYAQPFLLEHPETLKRVYLEHFNIWKL